MAVSYSTPADARRNAAMRAIAAAWPRN